MEKLSNTNCYTIKIMVGCREEIQQEATTSLAVAVAVPTLPQVSLTCLRDGPSSWPWVMWDQHPPSPPAKSSFLLVGLGFLFSRMWISLLCNGEKKMEMPFNKQIILSFSPCRCPQRYVAWVGGQGVELGLSGWWEEELERILLHCRTT